MSFTPTHELAERLADHLAPISSDEGQAKIADSSHVYEVWEDGEVTLTKAGQFFRKRTMKQAQEPWLPRNQQLWDVPEGKDHQSYVLLSREGLTVIKEYMEEGDFGYCYLTP
ncbi:hypothetical protein HUG10_21160 (plasmid) [Halorarum halophilum]|uniref:Uncharacterized protein n=1 Tax=Halorarum halophilum TaxID=2743090 RepID=A0A7D5KYL2_9EURY|nr:hypothetical protein [Halobaculum halophilum]QLG30098.1 hypothetical protein HUG10_21160 [Halobaculum halophilum]